MVLETLFGGLLGGVTRLAPEVMTYFDKKNERVHELAMQDKQLEASKVQQASALAQAQVQADSAYNTGAMAALKEAITGQSKPTGVAWVDALSGTVRPVITYALVLLYAYSKVITGRAWGEEDMAMLAAVLNFWFLSRVIDKKAGK